MVCVPVRLKNYSRTLKTYRNYCINNGKPPWRALFFGADDFSLYSLDTLFNEYKSGALLKKLDVVTNVKGKANAVRKFAERNNIKILNWPVTIPENTYDVGLVVSFGHLIPKKVINQFPLGMINVHASLLPRWRGAAPIIYALANGDTQTGISIMRIKPKQFDVGDILSQAVVEIPENMKMPELHSKLGNLGASQLVQVLQNFTVALNNAKPQPTEGVMLAPKVSSDFANINWAEMNSRRIYNLERALTDVFYLTTSWQSTKVKLINIRDCGSVTDKETMSPGFVSYDKNSKVLRIFCADKSCISVAKVGVLGKRTMSAADFNNGFVKKELPENRYFK